MPAFVGVGQGNHIGDHKGETEQEEWNGWEVHGRVRVGGEEGIGVEMVPGVNMNFPGYVIAVENGFWTAAEIRVGEPHGRAEIDFGVGSLIVCFGRSGSYRCSGVSGLADFGPGPGWESRISSFSSAGRNHGTSRSRFRHQGYPL